MLKELSKLAGSKIVPLRFSDHGTKEMLGVVGRKAGFDRFQTVRNNIQQHATGWANGRNI